MRADLPCRVPTRGAPSGAVETRPRSGLSPNSPQQADGIRIEPPPSPPMPTGTIPAATATAVPPLEPPGVCSGFHGLRVIPPSTDSVNGQAELRHPGLADDHRAGFAQPAHQLAVLGGGGGVAAAAEGGDAAGDVDLLLDRDGDAVQRARRPPRSQVPVPLRRLRPRLVGEDDRERVQGRVALGDARQARLDHLDGGDLPVRRTPGQLGRRSGRPGGRAACRSPSLMAAKASRLPLPDDLRPGPT